VVAMNADKQAVMVNGVPGRMAHETACAVVRRGLDLVPYALTGPQEAEKEIDVNGVKVELIKPDGRAELLSEVKSKYPGLICVDYTHPSAANPNVKAYCNAGLSFVIGTTGGDEEQMRRDVDSADGVFAVIAPNMGKQIVAFQAMMNLFATEFPDALTGYELKVVESHQKTKADTSGTAKAIIASLNQLGVDFSVDQVEKVRNEEEQLNRVGVPEENLKGHAYHTYTLTSPDGTVTLEFKHNVRGRRVYAEGTVDAVQWLAKMIAKGGDKQVFNMIDILKTGTMR